MPDNKLSASEAALIAQVRAQLGKQPPAAAARKTPDAATRIAALMAEQRAQTETLRRKQRIYYVWVPVGFVAFAGFWTLLWLWSKI